ncbi:MAG: hypothetical protein RXQ79_07640 [Acidilobus sp.]
MSQGAPRGRPALFLIAIAIFLVLLSGVVTIAYAATLLSASSNPNSNLTRALYNMSHEEGYNYTIPQVQAKIRQASEVIIGIGAFMAILGVLTWLYVYRPDVRGQYYRASMSSLMLGILYILAGFNGNLYTVLLCLVGGAILIYVWYVLRRHARLAEAEAAAQQSPAGM